MLTTGLLLQTVTFFSVFLSTIHAATPSPGCNNAPTEGELGFGLLPGDFTNFQRQLPNTQKRTHRLYLPNNYDDATNSPPPLILHFHGWGGNQNSCGGACSDMALQKGFVVVTMTGYGPNNYNSWKIGGSADTLNPLGPTCAPNTNGYCNQYKQSGCNCNLANNCWWTTCYDSVEQVLSVLDEMEQTICYDMEQVWAVGCSNGGMFTFELARDERSATRLKGIIPIVGLPHWGFSDGPFVEGIQMMGMWGNNDKVVPPISNTDEPDKTMDTSSPGWYYTSSNKVMKDWTEGKGCVGTGQDAIDTDDDWGIGSFGNQLSCTQGCTEKANSDRVVGCIFNGGHVCNGNFIWDPVFNFMLSDKLSDDKCDDEKEDAEFIFGRNKQSGELKIRTCGWLQDKKKPMNVCRNKIIHTENYSPAQDVCKITCKSCACDYQNPKTKFVKKLKNNGGVQLKNCKWLGNQNEETISLICSKALVGKGYKTAAEACPVTCDTTSC